MYTLATAISYVETAAIILSVTMLVCIGFLYVRVKWFNTPYFNHRGIINRALRYAENNAKLLLGVLICWLILIGIEVNR